MKASKIIKALVLATAAFVAFSASAKAAKGSCIKKAIALKGSQTATLVAEYDPEEKETYDEGVAYYSITLQRGMSYTIWIEGGDAEDLGFDVDINDEEYDKAKYEKDIRNQTTIGRGETRARTSRLARLAEYDKMKKGGENNG